MFKKIMIGLGIAAAAGLVLVLAPLVQRPETMGDGGEDIEEEPEEESEEQ